MSFCNSQSGYKFDKKNFCEKIAQALSKLEDDIEFQPEDQGLKSLVEICKDVQDGSAWSQMEMYR